MAWWNFWKKPAKKPVTTVKPDRYEKHWNKDVAFKSALAIVFAFEGGYSNDRHDSGGKTKFGIIEKEARQWGYNGDMRDLTREFASNIYYKKYWTAHRLNSIASFSPEIAMEVFEMGVNMGSPRGVKAFQRSLNILNRNEKLYNNITVDGIMGLVSIKTFMKLPSADYPVMIKLINCIQGEYYMKFIENNETQEAFARGWFKRVHL